MQETFQLYGKVLKSFYKAGFVDSVPMMTGIQAEGACPVTNAFKNMLTELFQ